MAENKNGVVHHLGPVPPVAPGIMQSAVKQVTAAALGQLPPGAGGAVVKLTHDKGVEVAFAHRGRNGKWQVDAWVGKNFSKASSIEWGAEAKILW